MSVTSGNLASRSIGRRNCIEKLFVQEASFSTFSSRTLGERFETVEKLAWHSLRPVWYLIKCFALLNLLNQVDFATLLIVEFFLGFQLVRKCVGRPVTFAPSATSGGLYILHSRTVRAFCVSVSVVNLFSVIASVNRSRCMGLVRGRGGKQKSWTISRRVQYFLTATDNFGMPVENLGLWMQGATAKVFDWWQFRTLYPTSSVWNVSWFPRLPKPLSFAEKYRLWILLKDVNDWQKNAFRHFFSMKKMCTHWMLASVSTQKQKLSPVLKNQLGYKSLASRFLNASWVLEFERSSFDFSRQLTQETVCFCKVLLVSSVV